MATVLNEPESLDAESVLVPGLTPWDCLARERDAIAGSPLMIWESRGGEALVGIGALCRIEASGPGRFREIRESLRSIQARWSPRIAMPSGFPGPVAFGGFAFAPGGRSVWPAFANALFHIPARTFWQQAGTDRTGCVETRWSAGPEAGPPAGAPEAHAANAVPAFDREGWNDAVRGTLSRIREGALSKAVLARSVTVPLPPGRDALDVYASLRAAYPSCNRFLIDDGRGSAFLGASPESLVAVQLTRVMTEAVAGTVRCGAGDDIESLGRTLLNSTKDRSEHDAVLRHLREALEPISIGPVRYEEEPELLRVPHLLHLRTRVIAWLRSRTHVLDLVERLHPTPAVAGWPQRDALEWIARTEPQDRGWYAGPIGWADDSGRGNFAVGIRSIAIRGNEARVVAGAGIVEGSDPEQEWNETELKMKGILDAIARD